MTSEEFRTDPMFLRNQFDSNGIFEIPLIRKDEIDLDDVELIGYDKLCNQEYEKIVHFFLDDYKFEVLWRDPEPRIERLRKYKAVLSPNYSLYTEMPLSLKIYNTFRSRWCGAYLQSKGITVIPTVAWGEPDTFWFCFDGIQKNSIVAVSTLGVRTEKNLFLQGYSEMIRRIAPKAIICYGKPFDEMKGNIIKIDYEKTNNFVKNFSMLSHIEPAMPSSLYQKTFSGCIEINHQGMGAAHTDNSEQEQEATADIPQVKLDDLPENVRNSYNNYKKNDWKGNYHGQSKGTRSGSMWENRNNQLPTSKGSKAITYREFDINNRTFGSRRDSFRFVIGSDGHVYYTTDHYRTFFEIIE